MTFPFAFLRSVKNDFCLGTTKTVFGVIILGQKVVDRIRSSGAVNSNIRDRAGEKKRGLKIARENSYCIIGISGIQFLEVGFIPHRQLK